MGDIDWEANLASLYYDLAGAHSPEVIRMLLTITTPDHLLYGSDYPYVAPQALTQSLRRMRQYLTAEPDLAPFRKMILSENARHLWGLSPGPSPEDGGRSGEGLICRIAEIEVHPQHLREYLTFAEEVDRKSMELEPGVICLFPMRSAEDSAQIRILEIYASDEAYRQHIRTPHFLNYKQGTLHMVKSLKLSAMQPLDPETMNRIFRKQ